MIEKNPCEGSDRSANYDFESKTLHQRVGLLSGQVMTLNDPGHTVTPLRAMTKKKKKDGFIPD